MVTLAETVLRRYERLSLYNSPYPAHDFGHAIDLYSGSDTDAAISPVSGTVRSIETVRCPRRPYAAVKDHVLLIECGSYVARLLHVSPTVEVGEQVDIGDPLGTVIRSGFFAQWVDNHIHLGFRRPEQNLTRASGSLRIDIDVPVTGIGWDGQGTVVETGPTHIRLDSPSNSGSEFAALASDAGVPLDGGLIHYNGGGTLKPTVGDVSLLGTAIGTSDGRNLSWNNVAVYANGRRASGLSLFVSQGTLGTKLLFHDGHDISVGETVDVMIEPTADPIRLG